MITSKSLFHANIALVFDETGFVQPENQVIAGLFAGKEAVGARFTDDPVMRTKILVLPELQMRLLFEGSRFRVEDQSALEPEKSKLSFHTYSAYQQLFARRAKLSGFGFNFDLVFRANQVIPIHSYFLYFLGGNALQTSDLRDFGFQFTLERSKEYYTDLWFFKIVSPLEIAVHLNRHFNIKQFPTQEKLTELFKNCYNDTDTIIENLRI